jgi:hypothetical protein
MKADYSFAMGELEKIRIVRNYASKDVGSAAMDGYLVYLGRINATLVPVVQNESETVYYAMTDEAHYELKLEKVSKRKTSFTVLIQSRVDSPTNTSNYTAGLGWAETGETSPEASFTK